MNINSVLFQTAAIGDYLFLIMIVLASIIQAIVQNKKKKVLPEQDQEKMVQNSGQIPEVMGQKPERMSGYDTAMDNIFDSVERILNPEPEDGKHIWGDDYPVTETTDDDANETVESTISSEEMEITDNKERNAMVFQQEPLKDTPVIIYKSRIRKGFSLRKAVVYSEILNRKYT